MNKQFAIRAGKAGLLALTMAAPMAFAAGEAEAGLNAVKGEVLTFIGLGIAAGFALLGASLAPDIAMGLTKKWVKKGAK